MPWDANTLAPSRPGEMVRKHWWSRKKVATTVHDVWVKATLAATHAAAAGSEVATLNTTLTTIDSRVKELHTAVDALSEVVRAELGKRPPAKKTTGAAK